MFIDKVELVWIGHDLCVNIKGRDKYDVDFERNRIIKNCSQKKYDRIVELKERCGLTT